MSEAGQSKAEGHSSSSRIDERAAQIVSKDLATKMGTIMSSVEEKTRNLPESLDLVQVSKNVSVI